MKIYLDNAASTILEPSIKKNINKLFDIYGNPSSIHDEGRKAKVIVEKARKNIAKILNTQNSQILFTSGATESNNLAIFGAINSLNIKNIISSKLEHLSILKPIEYYHKQSLITANYLEFNNNGVINYEHLEHLLKINTNTLLAISHCNSETGNLLPIKNISKICRQNNAYLLVDIVQTIGHFNIDIDAMDIDFATASSHKFHGIKGTGLLYINNKKIKIEPQILGGHQESNMRAGTENLLGIAVMAEALEIARNQIVENQEKIKELKYYFIEKLRKNFKNIQFVGENIEKSINSILAVAFDTNKQNLIELLDINGICASSGSACSSGTNKISNTYQELGFTNNVIRFSFSKFNNLKQIDYCIKILKNILK